MVMVLTNVAIMTTNVAKRATNLGIVTFIFCIICF